MLENVIGPKAPLRKNRGRLVASARAMKPWRCLMSVPSSGARGGKIAHGGEGLGVKRLDRKGNRPADVVGKTRVEVVDLHVQLPRLPGLQLRVEIGRDGDNRHDLPGPQQRLGLFGAGRLELE